MILRADLQLNSINCYNGFSINLLDDYTVFSTSTTLKKTSANDISSNTGLFVLRENDKDSMLKLYTSSYNVQLFTNTTDLYVVRTVIFYSRSKL